MKWLDSDYLIPFGPGFFAGLLFAVFIDTIHIEWQSINWNAVGAIATFLAALTALLLGTMPSFLKRKRLMKAVVLDIVLITYTLKDLRNRLDQGGLITPTSSPFRSYYALGADVFLFKDAHKHLVAAMENTIQFWEMWRQICEFRDNAPPSPNSQHYVRFNQGVEEINAMLPNLISQLEETQRVCKKYI
ncbi:hypothetical protein [Kordiimonas aestuarii]|uniref:hypothetical protein n=1 Tax=Kordiimonas aestuarii TaxID=1005925 RepID=UPI0021D25660|nr:hypothetical protein [Kordiimonas aestuarii]